MGLPLFIHLNHPCEEVDLWRIQQPELEKVARGQGYIYIEELRKIVSSHADLLEACEKVAAIVIDKYDACDTPLNEAWDACVKAIEKAKGG